MKKGKKPKLIFYMLSAEVLDPRSQDGLSFGSTIDWWRQKNVSAFQIATQERSWLITPKLLLAYFTETALSWLNSIFARRSCLQIHRKIHTSLWKSNINKSKRKIALGLKRVTWISTFTITYLVAMVFSTQIFWTSVAKASGCSSCPLLILRWGYVKR